MTGLSAGVAGCFLSQPATRATTAPPFASRPRTAHQQNRVPAHIRVADVGKVPGQPVGRVRRASPQGRRPGETRADLHATGEAGIPGDEQIVGA